MFTRGTRIFLGALFLLLVLAAGYAWLFLQSLTGDNYSGQPQVVGLPPGFDPLAATVPYEGPHPARLKRPPDPYTYPIPLGEPGPVKPTYADALPYPFVCRTERSGLGPPLIDNQDGAGVAVRVDDKLVGYSKDCSIASRVDYYYLSTVSQKFLPLDAAAADIAEISLNGATLPFIVRMETGTINRHPYIIALLRGPEDAAESPDLRHWNRKLIYQFRGGVGIGRRQGRIDPAYIPANRAAELGRGYAVAYSSANQTSTSYDMQLAEDTVARVKRQFIARYGKPLYTIGLGKSGGAIQQYLIGQNRPGLLDAGIAMYSYPDTVTQITRVMDCELLEYYFDVVDKDNPKWQRWSNRSWIEGFNARDDLDNPFAKLRALQKLRLGQWPAWSKGHTECSKSWRNLTPHMANPRYSYFESLFAPEVAEQVPFTYWDDLKHVYGTDKDGYGRRTFDNVGVQYGLAALRNGDITLDEFLHLNENIGGWLKPARMSRERFWNSGGAESSLADMAIWSQHNMTATATPARPAPRNAADPGAIAAAYRSGNVFLGELSMPVIDFRHYLEPRLDMHHSLQSFAVRLRMLRQQGHADNQLIWFADTPYEPLGDALEVLEQWLGRMQEDPTLSVAAARPATATDRCYDGSGRLIASGTGVWDGVWNGQPDGACLTAYPPYSNPRLVAGDDYAGDILKCRLQSIDEALANGVYHPVDVTGRREELQRVFPTGVCDYSLGDAVRPDDIL